MNLLRRPCLAESSRGDHVHITRYAPDGAQEVEGSAAHNHDCASCATPSQELTRGAKGMI